MAALVAAALLAGSCSETTGPNSRVARVEVNLPGSTLLIGTTSLAVARGFDINGTEVTDAKPVWRSSEPEIVDVDQTGVLRADSLGEAVITATMGNTSGSATITVVPLPVVSISISPSGGGLDRGQSLQLAVTLRDQFGEIIVGRQVSWVSSAPGIASVTGTGFVSAIAAGSSVITATSEGQSASVTINVIVTPIPGGPAIEGITPALLVPGGTARITGTLFGPTPGENEVRIAGVLATVTEASGTELTVQLPASGFSCEATREVFVQVARGSAADARLHPLQSLPQRTLQPGESLILSSPSDARCVELSATGGRYVVSVYNTGTQVSTPTQTGFRLRGARGLLFEGDPIFSGAPPATRAAASAPPALAVLTTDIGDLLNQAAARARSEAHGRILEENLRHVRSTPVPLDVPTADRRAALRANQATVGAILPYRIPNVGGFLSGGLDFCTSHFPVNARVVYTGTRAIVVEDTAQMFNGNPTFAGQMDTLYQKLGQELDQLMFGIVQTNFGDPLRMDDLLDANGKIVMLFSPRINTFSGVAGFVVTCDFFNPTTFPSSNRAEVFYATVPMDQGTQFSGSTRAQWFRTIRSTVVHETKHIAAFSNRIRDFGSALEEPWIEEGTARHAEEIWARTAAYNDLEQSANAEYASTLFCDIRPEEDARWPQCFGKPWAMFRHFGQSGLYDYLQDNELRSPLGPKTGFADGSYYGTSWSLIRWAIDHRGTSEAAFLGALVKTVQSGVPNLTARAGRSWDEMLGEWSLMLYADDIVGLTPVNPRLTFPSWNLRSLFLGMNNDLRGQGLFPRPFPLVPRATAYGDFVTTVPGVAGGSFAMFELIGPQTGRQLLELRSATGGDPNPLLRVAILRVE